MGRDIFGGEIEEEVEDISGRKVIGTVEKVKLIGKDGKEIEVEAKIDTGAGFTSIDINIAKQLGFEDVVVIIEEENIKYEEIKNLSKEEREVIFKKNPDVVDTAVIHSSHGTTYRPMVIIKIIMDNLEIETKVTIIDRSDLKYPAIIGKRNLGKFLIDVNK